MTVRHLSAEENKLLTVLERLPFPEEEKKNWMETIHNSGLNEELIKEIRAKIPGLPKSEPDKELLRARHIRDLNELMRRWRLSLNLRHAGKR